MREEKTTTADKRAKVLEHRITRNVLCRDGRATVRLWVESDPNHGGATRKEATTQVTAAEDAWRQKKLGTMSELVELLFEALPSANSVEVCDAVGNGVALHRDWP